MVHAAALSTLHKGKIAMRAGRITSKRTQGKLIFYDLKAEGAKVQIMANSRYCPWACSTAVSSAYTALRPNSCEARRRPPGAVRLGSL